MYVISKGTRTIRGNEHSPNIPELKAGHTRGVLRGNTETHSVYMSQ